jgi:hypothetical protein
MSNPCSILQGLVNWEMNMLRLLNKKFDALKRLAALLEQLGDISSLLPNISGLIPVANIDISAYTDLQVNCPFLNLPPYSNENIAQLRSKVNAAYADLARMLSALPHLRMGKVQGMLNDFQETINFPYGEDYIRCLNSICAAIGTAGSLLKGLSQTDIQKELELFGQNFVDNAGQVLTEPMRIKHNEALQVYNQVLDLRDESVQDYQTITASGEVIPNSPPLRLGTPTDAAYTFDATQLQQLGFPPRFPSSLSPTPSGVGSVMPTS